MCSVKTSAQRRGLLVNTILWNSWGLEIHCLPGTDAPQTRGAFPSRRRRNLIDSGAAVGKVVKSLKVIVPPKHLTRCGENSCLYYFQHGHTYT